MLVYIKIFFYDDATLGVDMRDGRTLWFINCLSNIQSTRF